MRRTRSAVLAVLSLGLLLSRAAGVSATPSTCDAVAHHENAAHTGFSCTNVPTAPTKKWSVKLNGGASYPLIAGGKVFVTTSDPDGPYGGWLYALNTSDGSVAWGPIPLSGTYYYFTLAYDGGRVFVNDFDGTVRAFDADTGAQVWATETSYFSGEPVATGGVVWLQGASTVFGLSEKNGRIVAQSGGLDGDGGAPAVDRTGVYLSTGCESQYKLSLTGSTVWYDNDGCSGGGAGSTALWNGLMYGGDGSEVLRKPSGVEVSTFPGTPAFSGSDAFFGFGASVFAQNAKTRVPLWTATVKGTVLAGPIATSAAIFVATSKPALVALDPATGAVLSSVHLRGQPGGGYQYSGCPSDIAAGESILVVPTGNTVTAFG